MKHDMERGMRYVVTKDSDDGTFVVGDKIELLHDNAIGNCGYGSRNRYCMVEYEERRTAEETRSIE